MKCIQSKKSSWMFFQSAKIIFKIKNQLFFFKKTTPVAIFSQDEYKILCLKQKPFIWDGFI
jgi:hypothetical protein